LPEIETIYIKRKNTLQPRINIHNEDKVEKQKPKKTFLLKKPKISKKFHRKKLIAFFVLFTILIPVITVTHSAGYIPISSLMEIKEPIGNYQEITYSKILSIYPVLNSIPELDKIKHKLFSTDEDMSIVSSSYKFELEREGYELKYQGTETIKGVDVKYIGFVKGLTAVVILLTDEDIDFSKAKTYVVYSTGSIFDYKDMIQRYGGHF